MPAKPYQPDPLPIETLDKDVLFSLVGEANAALARYDGLLMAMVNPAVMLSPLTNQEAVLSSRIEGTQATVEEVLEHEAGQEYGEDKKQDIQEIINYRRALHLATESVTDRPISLGLIRELHKVLMDSVRGQDKEPGEFRKDQNWIGAPGCPIEQATFIPPGPLQLMDHMHNWESYLSKEDADPIMQTAIVHAQFELLHPFKDGNGRIGRLLIPLFLFSKDSLSGPMFYLSAYLERNRDEYYARLRAVSEKATGPDGLPSFCRQLPNRRNKTAQHFARSWIFMKSQGNKYVTSHAHPMPHRWWTPCLIAPSSLQRISRYVQKCPNPQCIS